MKSNCILYAVACWFKSGGYIVLRKSNYGWWPHMLWTKDFTTFAEFTPRVHVENAAFPPLLFRGSVMITNRDQQIANGLKRATKEPDPKARPKSISSSTLQAIQRSSVTGDRREAHPGFATYNVQNRGHRFDPIHPFDIGLKVLRRLHL
jgi:hypothetical protein